MFDPNPRKYGNTKTIRDGIKFDSKTEADYYIYLKHQQAKGNVIEFDLQPELVLIPKHEYFGQNVQAMKYILDFKVTYKDESVEYIDIKGYGTDVSKNKLKHARFLNPGVKITWISYDKYRGWIEYDELQRLKREEEKRSVGHKVKAARKKPKPKRPYKPKRKINYPYPR